MENEYVIPGMGIINETAGEDQHMIPGEGFVDADSTAPPPTPVDRRRPVIIACGG